MNILKSYFDRYLAKIEDGLIVQCSNGLIGEGGQVVEGEINEGITKVSRKKIPVELLLKNNSSTVQQPSAKAKPNKIDYYISEFNRTDAAYLKTMMETQKLKELSLEKKAQQKQKEIQQLETEAKKQQQIRKAESMELHKLKVIESMYNIEKNREKRIGRSFEEKKRLLQIKSKKNLYEKMEETWMSKELKQKQKKQEAYRKFLQTKRVDFEEIQQHQIVYDEKAEKMRQSRMLSSRIFSNPTSFYQSAVRSRVIEEEIEAKQKVFEKSRLAREFAEKKLQFSQMVRQNYQPNITAKSQLKIVNQSAPIRSLSHQQTLQKGNEYLRSLQQELKAHKKSQYDKRKQFGKSESTYFKYRNYLADLKLKREEQTIKVIPEIKKSRSEMQINKIMDKKGLKRSQKLEEAKLVLKRYESLDFQKKNPYKLIDSINTKIHMLKRLQV